MTVIRDPGSLIPDPRSTIPECNAMMSIPRFAKATIRGHLQVATEVQKADCVSV
jgi:hypothetical protein